MTALKPDQVTVLVDTREQRPYDFPTMRVQPATLTAGDYSVRGMENDLAVERKELSDLISCIGPGRERFEREMARLRGYQHRIVIVEADWYAVRSGAYRSALNPLAATHSILSWQAHYRVPFLFAGDREAGEAAAAYFLFTAAKHAWQRGEAFREALA